MSKSDVNDSDNKHIKPTKRPSGEIGDGELWFKAYVFPATIIPCLHIYFNSQHISLAASSWLKMHSVWIAIPMPYPNIIISHPWTLFIKFMFSPNLVCFWVRTANNVVEWFCMFSYLCLPWLVDWFCLDRSYSPWMLSLPGQASSQVKGEQLQCR